MARSIVTQIASILLIAFSAWAGPECTYDTDNQIKRLNEIAAANPGAVVDEKENTVQFKDSNGQKIVITYGGCDHLGFTIESNEMRGSALGEAEVFARAIALAEKYWDAGDADALKKALTEKTFQKQRREGGFFYTLPHDTYDQFVVESEFLKTKTTRMTVRIFYSRTF